MIYAVRKTPLQMSSLSMEGCKYIAVFIPAATGYTIPADNAKELRSKKPAIDGVRLSIIVCGSPSPGYLVTHAKIPYNNAAGEVN